MLVEKNNYDFSDFNYINHNTETFRTCNFNEKKGIYCVFSFDGNLVLILDNEEQAMKILNSKDYLDLNGRNETDLYEEIEKITPENIEEKSAEILLRFNKYWL